MSLSRQQTQTTNVTVAADVQNNCHQVEHASEDVCSTDQLLCLSSSAPARSTLSRYIASAGQHSQSSPGRLGLVEISVKTQKLNK